MRMCKIGRSMPAALLLPTLLVAAGCSDRKPPVEERSIEENLADTRPVVSAPVALPAARLAPVPAETPRTPPPAEPPSAEAQMQDDAAASGMTSQIPNTADNAEPPASADSR